MEKNAAANCVSGCDSKGLGRGACWLRTAVLGVVVGSLGSNRSIAESECLAVADGRAYTADVVQTTASLHASSPPVTPR